MSSARRSISEHSAAAHMSNTVYSHCKPRNHRLNDVTIAHCPDPHTPPSAGWHIQSPRHLAQGAAEDAALQAGCLVSKEPGNHILCHQEGPEFAEALLAPCFATMVTTITIGNPTENSTNAHRRYWTTFPHICTICQPHVRTTRGGVSPLFNNVLQS